MAEKRRWFLYVALATLMFSTSAVFIRWTAPVSPYVITWGRLAVATLTAVALALFSRQTVRLGKNDIPRLLLFGGIIALHLYCYITALGYTTIAHTLTLAYTAPVFITLFSALFLHEPIARWKYAGVLVAVAGVAILAGFEPRIDRRMLIGDALALGSAVTYALYSIAGRSQRDRYPLLTYMVAVYAAGTLWMTPAALPLIAEGWGWRQVAALVVSGIFPLGIAQTLYTAALRRAHATYVNLVASQEVTGGILLGWLLLGEAPTWNVVIGAAVTLIGTVLVLVDLPQIRKALHHEDIKTSGQQA